MKKIMLLSFILSLNLVSTTLSSCNNDKKIDDICVAKCCTLFCLFGIGVPAGCASITGNPTCMKIATVSFASSIACGALVDELEKQKNEARADQERFAAYLRQQQVKRD